MKQHAASLQRVGLGTPPHHELIDWLQTLPPFLDLGGMRVVHAWRSEELVE